MRAPRKVEVFWGVWEFDLDRLTGSRAGRPAATYPQVIHRFIVIGEFGSLKLLDTGLGPRAFLRTTRALGTRSFGLGPWFYSRETI